jgi:hypothetical protein
MTAIIIKSKKFKAIRLVFGMAFAVLSTAGMAKSQLPLLHNVGIVPVQWEGVGDDEGMMGDILDRVKESFPKVVRDSQRFSFLNDDLVASLWNSPEGRLDLAKQYELQGFASLTANIQGDTASFVARLISPELTIYMSESERTPISWLTSASKADIDEKMKDLVFRLFNRLPIDMSVTSVQGEFVTLSGGEKQGVRVNDVVDVVRPFISGVHPADGTWVMFNNMKLGTAKIVDVKNRTAVARLEKLSFDNAVQVGDGVKSKDIAGRARFKRTAEAPELKDAGGSTILTPLYDGKPVKKSEYEQNVSVPKLKESAKPEARPTATPVAVQNESIAGDTQAELSPEEEPTAERSSASQLPFLESLAAIFTKVSAEAGPRLWNASGAGSASSALPLWIFNHFGLNVAGEIMEQVGFEAGGYAEFGPANSGSYTGFGGVGRVVYTMPTSSVPFVKALRGGALVNADSRSAPDASYGGNDLFSFGPFGGVEGIVPVAGSKIDWGADLNIYLLSFGRVGVNGSFANVSSGFGMGLKLDGYLVGQPKSIEWGAGLRFGNQNVGFPGGTVTISDTMLLLNARYRF